MHRSWWVSALLLLALPGAAAQPDSLLEDPEGDTVLQANDQDLGPTAAGGEACDLLGLVVVEERQTLTFTLHVATIELTAEYVVQHSVHFSHGDSTYLLLFSHVQALDEGWRWALYANEPGTFLRQLDSGQAAVDAGDATLTATVVRDMLVDSDGAAPRPGSPIHAIWADSGCNDVRINVNGSTSVGAVWRDAMGEDAPARFDLQMGIEQTGHLRLLSQTPFRASNGEATTFLFKVTLHNDRATEDVVRFQAKDVPRGWDVVFPVDVARLQGGASRDVAVVVSTPFAHQHGSLESFIVEATSQDDARAVGRVELGVRYPAIAQPAGHHDTLYLHSHQVPEDLFSLLTYALNEALLGAGSMQVSTMNTLEDDELDEDVPVEARSCGFFQGTIPLAPMFCWPTMLSPGLAMGLDFDLTREGTITVPIHNLLPAPTRLAGSLLWLGPPQGQSPFETRETLVLATIVSDVVDLPLDGRNDLKGRIVPTPESDYVPFHPGASLMLDLQVLVDRPENFFLGPRADKPELLPGGVLQLPLSEYQDPIDDVFGGQGLLGLAAKETHRLVNPGRTVIFQLNATNHGAAPAEATLRLIGNVDGWASLSAPRVTMKASQSAAFQVIVSVPADAVDGQRVDLIVEAAAGNSLDRVLLRLVAEVDTDADHPDEAAPKPVSDKKSPGPWALAPLLVAAVAVRLRSKRS